MGRAVLLAADQYGGTVLSHLRPEAGHGHLFYSALQRAELISQRHAPVRTVSKMKTALFLFQMERRSRAIKGAFCLAIEMSEKNGEKRNKKGEAGPFSAAAQRCVTGRSRAITITRVFMCQQRFRVSRICWPARLARGRKRTKVNESTFRR